MFPQNSLDQIEKISGYLKLGPEEGAKVLTGGAKAELPGDLAGGQFIQPTVFQGPNDMRVFQEEIFGPVITVASFTDYREAIAIANDTIHGLGSGVWSRDADLAYEASQDVAAARVWVHVQPVPRRRRIRWVQAVRLRPRDRPEDPPQLPRGHERAGQPRPQVPRLLRLTQGVSATPNVWSTS
ncbi:MAG TPA: aldehyde dehydrogenase family protein [Actinomycetes bacterium]